MNVSAVLTRSCRSLAGIIVLSLLSTVIVPSGARAGFTIQETETFDGNQIDTTTWTAMSCSPNAACICQQDCLIFSDMGECATAHVTVEVGDMVRVQLLEHPMGASSSYLYLTTKTRPEIYNTVYSDSHFAFIEYSYVSAYTDHGFTAGRGGSGGSSGRIFGLSTHPPLPGQPLTLQIQRVTENRFVSSAYDSNMVLIGEPVTSILFDLEHDAKSYICLAASPQKGGRSVFDNVQIIRAKADTPAKPSDGMDTLPQWQGDLTSAVGETPAGGSSQGMIGSTFGQTFRIDRDGWFSLDSISFLADDYAPSGATEACKFEVYVMPWSGVGPIAQTLYKSEPLTTTAAWRAESFTLHPRNVLLAGRVPYVVLFTANNFLNGIRSDALMASTGNFYEGGGLYTNLGKSFDDLFTQNWSATSAYTTDLAIKLQWSLWPTQTPK